MNGDDEGRPEMAIVWAFGALVFWAAVILIVVL